MAKSQPKSSKIFWFSLLFGVLFAFLFLMLYKAGGFLKSQPYYSATWQVEVDRAEARKALIKEAEASDMPTEPRGPGFREADQKKYHGEGYDTY